MNNNTKRKPRRRRRKQTIKKSAPQVDKKTIIKGTKNDMSDFYDYESVDRLNQIPDFTEMLNENIVENSLSRFTGVDTRLFRRIVEKGNISMLERAAIELVMMTSKKSAKDRDKLEAIKYLHARIGGKPKERIEHSGPKGKPIQLKTTRAEFDLSKMSDKQLDALEKIAKVMNKLPIKETEKEEEDE